jgi:hypothetical protein
LAQSIIFVDCYHYLYELFYRISKGNIASVPNQLPTHGAHIIMKRQMLLTLTLSILAANAFAMPAAEQKISAEARSSAVISQPYLAEDGSDRTPQAGFAENGSDRTPQATFAEDGSDRTPQATFAEDGSDRTPQATFAEDGSDRTPQATFAEDGSDRTPQATFA